MIYNKVISFHGRKGGIGKSTIMLNVARELAKRNKKVLIIDADGQGSSSMIIKHSIEDFSCDSPKWFSLGGKTIEETRKYVQEVLLKTIKHSKIINIDLVTGGNYLYEFSQDQATKIGKEKYLGRNLTIAKQFIKYDYILIDLNPAFDILAINVYLAADSIVQILDRSEMGLVALEENMLDWNSKAELFETKNLIKGILFNRVNSAKLSKEVFKALYSNQDHSHLILETFIPENSTMEKSVVTNGQWMSDVKRLDNWKPNKGLSQFLETSKINFRIGNPIVNLVDELVQKNIL